MHSMDLCLCELSSSIWHVPNRHIGRDGHHTVTDTAIEEAVSYGHSCSNNCTVNAQSTAAMVWMGTFMVITAMYTAVYKDE